ncbi:CbbQ/NirQ/NorQ/GpvN family protein [Noviherbaspirillum autotrophicum]|uniref:ATPase AAA n=1 Tax=Noviherbaspirillum autotrophicum TaxID=709839 RepID=A0A0C2BN70_9BURK|nr:CbbQ/NirQ/NorQ/GpvN family protein [Noviherbaspirillum autotrophicum]KIF81454.1 ATPase AAA [Noviherbaspirillum autotrophicum]
MQAIQARCDGEPFYLAQGDEIEIFAQCHRQGLPVMLKGPTGCGKTRFVEHMAWRLGRPMVSVACHDDLTASDLLGRFLIRGDETVWQDGPVTQAVRRGAILYLDEVVEARPDTTVVIHPLSDHRRVLSLDKTGEVIDAAPGFQLVISYNPSYQHALKDLKPSTRQRFVALEFDFPDSGREIEIVAVEGGVERACAVALVTLAGRIRPLRDRGLAEAPSTRVLVAAARLIAAGIPERKACEVAIAGPLTDDPTLIAAVRDLIAGHFH